MHFWKLNIVLLVLVSTFGYIHSQDDFDFNDGTADHSSNESDDNNSDSADDNGGIEDDDGVADDDKQDELSDEADSAPNKKTLSMQVNGAGQPCVAGTHIIIDCNICYCYKPGTMSCTTTKCDRPTKMALTGSPKKSAMYKKLRDVATGCVPGEKVMPDGCNCICTVPSVLVCNKNCVH